MMKYSATILLFATAVFWSSASARPPYDPDQSTLIDAFSIGVIVAIEGKVSEPHKTILINKVREAQHQHWDSFDVYKDYIKSMLEKYVRETGLITSRSRRDIGIDEELTSNEVMNSPIFYEAYARVLAWMAPPSHQAALLKKFGKVLEKDYDNFNEFEDEAVKIFEEETGLDYYDVIIEYAFNQEKLKEFKHKLAEEYNKLLAGANSEKTDSSEEDDFEN